MQTTLASFNLAIMAVVDTTANTAIPLDLPLHAHVHTYIPVSAVLASSSTCHASAGGFAVLLPPVPVAVSPTTSGLLTYTV